MCIDLISQYTCGHEKGYVIFCEKRRCKKTKQCERSKGRICTECHAVEAFQLRKECNEAEQRAQLADEAYAQCLGRIEALELSLARAKKKNDIFAGRLGEAHQNTRVAEEGWRESRDMIQMLTEKLIKIRQKKQRRRQGETENSIVDSESDTARIATDKASTDPRDPGQVLETQYLRQRDPLKERRKLSQSSTGESETTIQLLDAMLATHPRVEVVQIRSPLPHMEHVNAEQTTKQHKASCDLMRKQRRADYVIIVPSGAKDTSNRIGGISRHCDRNAECDEHVGRDYSDDANRIQDPDIQVGKLVGGTADPRPVGDRKSRAGEDDTSTLFFDSEETFNDSAESWFSAESYHARCCSSSSSIQHTVSAVPNEMSRDFYPATITATEDRRINTANSPQTSTAVLLKRTDTENEAGEAANTR